MILEPLGPWAEAFGRVCLDLSGDFPKGKDREHEIATTCEAFATSAAPRFISLTYEGWEDEAPGPLAVGHLNSMPVRGKIALARMFRKWHRLASYVRIEAYCLRHLVGTGAMFFNFGEPAAIFNVCVTQNPGVSNVADGDVNSRTVHVLPDSWGYPNRDGFCHCHLPHEWVGRADGTLVGLCRGLFAPTASSTTEVSAYSGHTGFHAYGVTPLACAVLADACDESGLHQTVGEMLRAGGAPAAQMLLSIRGAETFRSGTLLGCPDVGATWPAYLGRPRTTERLFHPWPGI